MAPLTHRFKCLRPIILNQNKARINQVKWQEDGIRACRAAEGPVKPALKGLWWRASGTPPGDRDTITKIKNFAALIVWGGIMPLKATKPASKQCVAASLRALPVPSSGSGASGPFLFLLLSVRAFDGIKIFYYKNHKIYRKRQKSARNLRYKKMQQWFK